MGERAIYTEDGAACYACQGYLEPGDPVHTFYGDVPGEMPENGEPFGVPVKCGNCCSA